MASGTEISPKERSCASFWHEAKGVHRLFGGGTPIGTCGAHFHETFIVGFIRGGSAVARINGHEVDLRPGLVLLVNPFDIVECDSQPLFDYHVCYPDQIFMQQVLLAACGQGGVPRFARHLVEGASAIRLGELLAELFALHQARAPEAIEAEICHLLARQPDLVVQMRPLAAVPAFVNAAFDLIERNLEQAVSVAQISAMVGKSRSDFARGFRDATGIPPSIYIRQLRLARALARIRDGEPLVDVALAYGFFDQAHFTRAFKRVYGTAPGRLARAVSRCRECG